MTTQKGKQIGVKIPYSLYTGLRNPVNYNNEPIEHPDSIWIDPTTGEAIPSGGDYVIEGDKIYERIPEHEVPLKIEFKLPQEQPIQPSNLEFYLLTGGPIGRLAWNGLKTVASDVANFGWRKFAGDIAKAELANQTANLAYQTATGSSNHYMTDAYNTVTNGGFKNPYIDTAGRFMFDMTNPAYWNAGLVDKAAVSSEKLVKNFADRFTPYGFRIGLNVYTLKPLQNILYSGFPTMQIEKTPIIKMNTGETYNLSTRPIYYEVDPEIIEKLPQYAPKVSVRNGLTQAEKLDFRNMPRRYRIDGVKKYDSASDQIELQKMLGEQNGYSAEGVSEEGYLLANLGEMFERPVVGQSGKFYPILSSAANSHDLMYSNAHHIYNQLSSAQKSIIEGKFAKIWHYAPQGQHSPGARAFAVIKELQSRLNYRFMTDNRFPVKNYNEWCEYVDDLDPDLLKEYLTKMHGGEFINKGNIRLSDDTLNIITELLKFNHGGKITRR